MRHIVEREDGKPQEITVYIGEYCNECPACKRVFDAPSFCKFMRGSEYASPKGEYSSRQFQSGFHTHPEYGFYVQPVPEWCPLRNGAAVIVRGELEKI